MLVYIGDTSVLIEAVGEISSRYPYLPNDNNGAQANMFAVTALQETTISDFAMNLDAGTATSIEGSLSSIII